MINHEKIFLRLAPVIPDQIDDLWIAYNSATTQKQRQDILFQLHQLHAKHLKCDFYEKTQIFLQPPSGSTVGNYKIGSIHYGDSQFNNTEFKIDDSALLNHTIVAGSSGTGKTNLISVLALQKIEKNSKFLILDWKASYRNLINLQKEEKLKVFTLGRDVSPVSFNMWVPPKGTLISEWILFIIDILERSYYAGLGVRDILLQAARDTFIRKGFNYENGEFEVPERAEYPTNFEIMNSIHSIKTGFRSEQWKQSTIRILQSLTFGAMSRICNDNKGISVNDLFDSSVILEMDVLSEADKTFIAQFLLLYRYRYLLRKEGKREELQHLFIIDEAHEILKKPQNNTNESIIDEIWRNIRELGQGIIACAQNPSLPSVSCLTNSYSIISFSLKSNQDIKQISGSLLLERDQEHYIGLLKTGQAIVKTQGEYRNPFLITVSKLDIPKGSVRDKDLNAYMKRFHTDSKSDKHSKGVILTGMRSTKADSLGESIPNQVPLSDTTVSTTEAEALKDIVEFPYSSVVERYERLGHSAHKGNEIFNLLVNKGLIEKKNVVQDRTRLTLFDFTKSGTSILSELRISFSGSFRQGKIEHRYYCDYMAKKLENRGYGVLRECPSGNGTFVDLVFFNSNNNKCAIELETGKSDFKLNVINALKNGFDYVFVVAISDLVKRKIQKCGFKSSKIHIISIKEFHKILKLLDNNAQS